jgi:hypothetical protein
MCSCENVEIGSYDNQVKMVNYWNGKIVCVDKCLGKEIQHLWDEGIQTAGCCCGHKKLEPMINVIRDDHNKMIKLGYSHWTNKHGVICYKPFSV